MLPGLQRQSAVRPKLEQAKTDAATPDRAIVLGDLVKETDPATVWERMTPDRRRAVVDMLVEIRIMPTGKGPRFDPKSVKVTWKTSPLAGVDGLPVRVRDGTGDPTT